MRKYDWVIETNAQKKKIGLVVRVTRDKIWADVQWKDKGLRYISRIPAKNLSIVTIIPVGGA